MKKYDWFKIFALMILLQACNGSSDTTAPPGDPVTNNTPAASSENTNNSSPQTSEGNAPDQNNESSSDNSISMGPNEQRESDLSGNYFHGIVLSIRFLQDGVKKYSDSEFATIKPKIIEQLKSMNVTTGVYRPKYGRFSGFSCDLSKSAVQVLDHNGGNVPVYYRLEGDSNLQVSNVTIPSQEQSSRVLHIAIPFFASQSCIRNSILSTDYSNYYFGIEFSAISKIQLSIQNATPDFIPMGIQQVQMYGIKQEGYASTNFRLQHFYDNPLVNVVLSPVPSYDVNQLEIFGLDYRRSNTPPSFTKITIHPTDETNLQDSVGSGFFLPNDFSFLNVNGCSIQNTEYFEGAFGVEPQAQDPANDKVINTLFKPNFNSATQCSSATPKIFNIDDPKTVGFSSHYRVATGIKFTPFDTAYWIDFGKIDSSSQDNQAKRQLYAFAQIDYADFLRPTVISLNEQLPNIPNPQVILGSFGGGGGESLGFYANHQTQMCRGDASPYQPEIESMFPTEYSGYGLYGMRGTEDPNFNNIHVHTICAWSNGESNFIVNTFHFNGFKSVYEIERDGPTAAFGFFTLANSKSVDFFTPTKLKETLLELQKQNAE